MANEKKKMPAELLERFKGKSAAKAKSKAEKPKKKEAVAKKDGMAEMREKSRAKRVAKKAIRTDRRARKK